MPSERYAELRELEAQQRELKEREALQLQRQVSEQGRAMTDPSYDQSPATPAQVVGNTEWERQREAAAQQQNQRTVANLPLPAPNPSLSIRRGRNRKGRR